MDKLSIIREEAKYLANMVYGRPFKKCRKVDRRKMITYIINYSIALKKYIKDRNTK